MSVVDDDSDDGSVLEAEPDRDQHQNMEHIKGWNKLTDEVFSLTSTQQLPT